MPAEAVTGAKAAWTERRRRASELAEQCPHAAPQLALYAALLDVQESVFHEALDARPAAAALPDWVAERVLSRVVDASVVHGPPCSSPRAITSDRPQSISSPSSRRPTRATDRDPCSGRPSRRPG